MLGTAEEVFEVGCGVSRYEKEFISMDGKVFSADVYSVLVAFGVTCPARQHAIKKLLMPGQRGSKGELQDLDEALVSVARAVDMAYARRDSHRANDVPEPKAGAPVTRPAHTESTVECFGKDSKEPAPEPKPKMVTWRVCVRIQPGELDEQTLFFRWYPSGDIPDDWYPIEAQSQPIETVQQLPEGEEP